MEKIIKTWAHTNIYILSLAGLCVLAYTLINWGNMPMRQQWVGLFIVAITCHEWEETRYPGGFFTLMTGMFGISDKTNKYNVEMAHGVVVIAIIFFAYVGFLFPRVIWLSLIPVYLGVFESFIHIMGIKIHGMKMPYTPGMITALLMLLPASIGIIVSVRGLTNALDWIFAVIAFFVIFALMEMSVWKCFGVKPVDFPMHARHARAYALKNIRRK